MLLTDSTIISTQGPLGDHAEDVDKVNKDSSSTDIHTKGKEEENNPKSFYKSKPLEPFNLAAHDLEDVLRGDFYLQFKHDKIDISEYMSRFEALRKQIAATRSLDELHFHRLKTMIDKSFPRGKKTLKTKERVDETVARVYTEATRRAMVLMVAAEDTEDLAIDSQAFLESYPELSAWALTRTADELRKLIAFHRAVFVAHRVLGLPCQGFRNHFMRIGALLENSGCFYAMGGRPAKTTLIRKELIDKLTQSSRCRRGPRKDEERTTYTSPPTVAKASLGEQDKFQSLLHAVAMEFSLACPSPPVSQDNQQDSAADGKGKTCEKKRKSNWVDAFPNIFEKAKHECVVTQSDQ